MITVRTRAVVFATLALAAPLAPAHAQIRASELQKLSQVVDGTQFTLTYSRPRLRGRSNVWGTRIVNWGEVWTPGANEATVLEINKDVSLAGVPIPKGKYSIWMIVSKDSTWTMLLDPKWKQYHTDHPVPNASMLRVPVKATLSAPTVEETLTWTFPSVGARGGTMAMQWERTRVTVPFTVTPTLSELLPSGEAAAYVGTYLLKDPRSGKEDTKLIVTYERGGLKGRLEPNDDYLQTFALMKVAPNYFTIGLFMSAEIFAYGEIYEVLRPDFMLTFTTTNGRTTLEARDADDVLFYSGRKLP